MTVLRGFPLHPQWKIGRCSQITHGTEPAALETAGVGYKWHYALLDMQARNDEDKLLLK